MIDPDLLRKLESFEKVGIAMKDGDGLKEGRDLVIKIQMDCPFPLVYVQRIGCDPIVVVWRMQDVNHAMKGYSVERYQA